MLWSLWSLWPKSFWSLWWSVALYWAICLYNKKQRAGSRFIWKHLWMGSETLWKIFRNMLGKHSKPFLKPSFTQIGTSYPACTIWRVDFRSLSFSDNYFTELYWVNFFYENQVMYTSSLSQHRKTHCQSKSKTIPNTHSRW